MSKESRNLGVLNSSFSIIHLRQHLILPPSAQSYSQQVIHYRGRLEADDPIVVVFRDPAQDGIAVSLKNKHKKSS